MYQRSILSAFNGRIVEIPGVYVDNFENGDLSKPRAYFLSHCHTDHMQGLHSTALLNYLINNNVFIYTTELSAAIIKHETRDQKLLEYVKVLELGSSLITLRHIPERNEPEILVTVSLIPAGHSAGAVMFLFRTISCSVLFTGDFRTNPSDVHKYAPLHDSEGSPIKINTMYVDTTFIDFAYENFPKRTESVEKMIIELDKWLDNDKGIALHTSAKYGYEFVFNEIYKKLGMKVYVDGERWHFYRLIPHLVYGVTNDKKHTRIHLCTKRNESNHTSCIPTIYPQFLYVHLSAMKWTNYTHKLKPVEYVTPTHIDVCFATHCSRSELMSFIEYLSPDKIIGFPNLYVERKGEKRKIDKHEDKKENFGEKKLDNNLLKDIFG